MQRISSIQCPANQMALLMVCRVHCNWGMGEQVASQILDLEPGKCCKLCVVIKPLVVGGKWDIKANVELLRKEEPGVNIQSGLCLKEVNTVEIC